MALGTAAGLQEPFHFSRTPSFGQAGDVRRFAGPSGDRMDRLEANRASFEPAIYLRLPFAVHRSVTIAAHRRSINQVLPVRD